MLCAHSVEKMNVLETRECSAVDWCELLKAKTGKNDFFSLSFRHSALASSAMAPCSNEPSSFDANKSAFEQVSKPKPTQRRRCRRYGLSCFVPTDVFSSRNYAL